MALAKGIAIGFPLALAKTRSGKEHSCHILNFFYDESSGCALTAVINGVRFHIIVDADEPKEPGSEVLLQAYLNRLKAVKDEVGEGDLAFTKKCAHGGDLLDAQAMVDVPQEASPNSFEDRDSAIDLSADQDKMPEDAARNKDTNAEMALQNWMLSAFGEETKRLPPPHRHPRRQTIHDWYYGQTHIFKLKAGQKNLTPHRLEESTELRQRIDELVPGMLLPKYIRDMAIPWLKPDEIEVLSEIKDPGPLQPGKVQVGKEVQFFKPVDSDQPQTTKREIKILMDIANSGLQDEIRAPKLLGLVAFPDSSTEAIGFLLTNMPDARPLTKLLDSQVADEKRLRWADESKSIVRGMHKHKIVWGDTKADNFMVDENDNLWIIDFGGSYTEGWVDPELAETKSGDQMGLGKIVDALVDPDENAFDRTMMMKTMRIILLVRETRRGSAPMRKMMRRQTVHRIWETEDIATVLVLALVRW